MYIPGYGRFRYGRGALNVYLKVKGILLTQDCELPGTLIWGAYFLLDFLYGHIYTLFDMNVSGFSKLKPYTVFYYASLAALFSARAVNIFLTELLLVGMLAVMSKTKV